MVSTQSDDNPNSALQVHIAELEAQIKDYAFREQICDAIARVQEAVAAITEEDDWRRVVEACNRELKSFIDFDGFSINLFESADVNTFVFYGVSGSEVLHGNVVLMAPSLRQAFASGAPVYRRTKREIAELDNETMSTQKGSVVDVPFAGGTVAISSPRENAFSDSDIDLLVQFRTPVEQGYHRLEYIRRIRERDEQWHKAQHIDSIGLLAAGVAHNFNNMLQGILGNIHMAKLDAPVGGQQIQRLEQAEAAGQRAAQLVRQLRLSVQPSAPLNSDALDPVAHVQSIVELARSTFNRLIILETHYEGDIPAINMDPSYFEQVVLNVLLNARDAITDPARQDTSDPRIYIHLSVGPSDLPKATHTAYLRIRIVDNGIGMDEATVQRMYEPFFTTKPPDRGTGLGLSTVRSIVENQGGHILCTSRPNEGTAIMINLALKSVAEASNEDVAIRILVVDDEDVVRESTKAILEYHGYGTLTARDGEEAIEVFRRRRPDIVLLDLSMPRMSGRDAFAIMRRIDPNAKILVYTGDQDELEAGDFGEDTPILLKPYLASDLVEKIAQVAGIKEES